MVKKIEDLNFYELLEVSPTASSQDIHRAYERIRRVYDPNSIALYSLFSSEETAIIHQRIEEAYKTLMYDTNRKKYDTMLRGVDKLPEPPPPIQPAAQKYERPGLPPLPPVNRSLYAERIDEQPGGADPFAPEEVSPVSPFIAEFTGPAIKVLREQRKLSVRNIADMTKVGARYLEMIEEEQYDKLPARPYLRGFLILYAKALGYDPERVVSDYLKRYDASKSGSPK
jgi:curved DNA-binding protein CbpA